jgi:hypothetical protein
VSFTALGFSLCRPYKEVDQLQELYIKALLCEIGDNERSAFKGISALERQLPTFPKQILYSMIKLNQTIYYAYFHL